MTYLRILLRIMRTQMESKFNNFWGWWGWALSKFGLLSRNLTYFLNIPIKFVPAVLGYNNQHGQ